MTDRYEIARDFLLQHFTPEELPEAMARVLKAIGRTDVAWPHRVYDRAFDARCRLIFHRYAPRLGVDPFSFRNEVFRDAIRDFLGGPIETPPRTSPPRETESAP